MSSHRMGAPVVPGGLVDAHVPVKRVGEIGAERRARGLIGHELALAGEGQPREVVPAPEIARAR